MTPAILKVDGPLPVHTHETTSDGGDLDEYLRLTRVAPQAMVGDLSVGGTVTAAGASLTGAVALASLETTPLQSTIDGQICTITSDSVTDAREWKHPDASGQYVMSKPALVVAARTTNYSGNVLTAPEAGIYLFAWYVETTTAGAAGTLALVLAHTGGSAVTQTAVALHSLSALGCVSGLLMARVVSGDVTAAATITGGAGSPAYKFDVVPLGRFA